jgi:hypothetical protein
MPRCPWCGTRRSGDPCGACGRSQALEPFDAIVSMKERPLVRGRHQAPRPAPAPVRELALVGAPGLDLPLIEEPLDGDDEPIDFVELEAELALEDEVELAPEWAHAPEPEAESAEKDEAAAYFEFDDELLPEWLVAAPTAFDIPGRGQDNDEPTAPRRAVGRREWTIAVGLLVAAWSLAVFGAAYGWTTANVLRRIEQAWLAADSMRIDRAEVDTRLANTDVDPQLRQTVALALDEEQRLTLQDITRRLSGQRILDPRVSDLRDEMVSALAAESRTLGADNRLEAFTELLLVDEKLDQQLGRFWLQPGDVREPLRLVSADYMLAGAANAADGG